MLGFTACNDNYKDWAEPASYGEDDPVNLTKSTITGITPIDFNLLDEYVSSVKLCDINESIDDAYPTNFYVYYFDDDKTTQDTLASGGYVTADAIRNYVKSVYGYDTNPHTVKVTVMEFHSNGKTSALVQTVSWETVVTLAPLAAPKLWYLIGSCIGDGSWNNDASAIGVSLIPLYPQADNYGVLEYCGYFPADANFKLIQTPGSWDAQWGMKNGEFVKNDGTSGNITVSEAGYYWIQYDMGLDQIVMNKYDSSVGVCSSMGMPGAYQGWDAAGDPRLSAMSTVVENHDWMLTYTFDTNTEAKFAADGSWGVNWGLASFPVGDGVQGGANIPIEAGTYTIFFNDIMGRYYFCAQ